MNPPGVDGPTLDREPDRLATGRRSTPVPSPPSETSQYRAFLKFVEKLLPSRLQNSSDTPVPHRSVLNFIVHRSN